MHIRPAIPSDFPTTASIGVLCFSNDELYQYANPWREQYPDNFRSIFLRRQKLRAVTPGIVFHIAVTDPGDEGHEPEGKVVGYAAWERRGKSEAAMKWRTDTYWNLLERTLLNAQETYLSLLRMDKSIDYGRLACFIEQAKETFPSIPEIWKLQYLAVHPAFQHRGVASIFLDWGKRQAEREGVPIGLESSQLARPLYLKNGFRRYGHMQIKDFPIEHVPTFLWEPRGMEGRWGVKGDDTGGLER